MITTPIDGKPATAANGGTIGIMATSPDQVRAWHAAGIAQGGTAIESPPTSARTGLSLLIFGIPTGTKLTPGRRRRARGSSGYRIQDDPLLFCAASSFSESRKPPFGTML